MPCNKKFNRRSIDLHETNAAQQRGARRYIIRLRKGALSIAC